MSASCSEVLLLEALATTLIVLMPEVTSPSELVEVNMLVETSVDLLKCLRLDEAAESSVSTEEEPGSEAESSLSSPSSPLDAMSCDWVNVEEILADVDDFVEELFELDSSCSLLLDSLSVQSP